MSRALRPYQEACASSVIGEWERGIRSTLAVMPTGAGKTRTAAEIVSRYGKRTLFMAHTTDLVTQSAESLARDTGLRVGIEMAGERTDKLFAPDVVCGTVQSLCRRSRLETFAPDHFGLVIVDEAHHAAADGYKAVLDYFQAARVLGLTATPDRSDKGRILGEGRAFETRAHVTEIRDLIEQKYLVPIKQRAVRVDGLDLSKVRTTAGDLNEGDLEALLLEEENLHGVAVPTLDLAGARPTLVFCTTIAHAKAQAEVLRRYRPGCAEHIDGTMDREERRRLLSRFKAGEFQFLANCQLLTEGVDLPFVECVAMARPTKSRALYVQAVGRALRLCPETGKVDALILDFEGNAGKHALVNVLDVLGGDADEAVRKRVRKILDKDPEQLVLEAIDEAARQLAAEKRKAVLAQATYRAIDVDPFSSVEAILGVHPRAGRWGGAEATDKQREFLKLKGIEIADLDKGQCSEVIDALKTRQAAGLCSFKQARVLVRYGFDTAVTFDEASRILDALGAARWKLTPQLRAQIMAGGRGVAA